MAAAKIVRLDIGGAKIKIPTEVVVRNFLDSLWRTAAPPAISGIPNIGEFWPGQGGVNAGLFRGGDGLRDYYLIVPTDPRASFADVKWHNTRIDIAGAKSDRDGLANTIAMAEAGSELAQKIRAFEIDGHKDFYLFARREARFCFVQVPELFEKKYHWTSTQYSPDSAWIQDFSGGHQGTYGEGDEFGARPVRRLFI